MPQLNLPGWESVCVPVDCRDCNWACKVETSALILFKETSGKFPGLSNVWLFGYSWCFRN